MIGESRIVQQHPERLEAQTAFSYVLVTIHAAAARLLRIVQVERADPLDADRPMEVGERPVIAVGTADVIPGREQMTGIDANTDARRSVQAIDDLGEVLEPVAEIRALTGRVLQQYPGLYVGTFGKELTQGFGDQPETIGLRAAGVRTGVHDEAVQTKRIGAIQFLAQRRDRLRTQLALGGGDVDQIAVVRDDRTYAGVADALPELGNLFLGKRPRAPLSG